MTKKQHEAVGRITGRHPESFAPEALRAFFAYTDRGINPQVEERWRTDYERLVDAHKWYEVTDKEMIMTFHECGGFLLADYLKQNLPLAFLIRVFDCCRKGAGFIPWVFYNGWTGWDSNLRRVEKPPEEFERCAPCYIL